ncbi:MAG: DUF6160 family protein [Pseudomonadales bacterium]|uniref:DUF6160 domain-containing protein n=1 Tax=Oleiphilus messinensis TaxID=141451 RepID=A0A1Y0ID09_9GAMM|nr:DUF6160 family protein [Oleiphilus messinensis]ARU57355.1 hypothetical protein OLMES_3315 [Oleiphilus messinensis]MCG8612670.1 DUF6160 family protein [Pseudomonadales bacterium]
MKGLNKIVLVTAIAAASTAAQAELKALDDTTMGELTGQAGLTIDVSAGASVSIGQIAYQDEGFLTIDDLAVTLNDALTITVDVAADGDLQIVMNESATTTFGLNLGSVNLAASGYAVGGDYAAVDSTVLLSGVDSDADGFDFTGTLGTTSLVIDNQTSALTFTSRFDLEGSLSVDFMNTSLDLRLHDTRGDTVAADGLVAVSAVVSSSTNGLGVELAQFDADLDLTNITMGSSPSIGDVYITDLSVSSVSLDIYGH